MSDDTQDQYTPHVDYVDITLRTPIDIGGTTVSVLRMREPSLKDQRTAQASKGDANAQELLLFANLTMQASADLMNLKLYDYLQLQKAFENFTQ